MESLFADSVESGNRSKIYSWNHFARQASMAIGPFINVVLFFVLGDKWEINVLKAVMIVGICISALSLLIGFLFKDERSLGSKSESIENYH